MEKMFKYKMVNNNKCKRCGNVETYKHLMWDCREAKKIWEGFNEFTKHENKQDEKVNNYDDIFKIGDTKIISKVKMKVIQNMIQVERPVNWSLVNVVKIASEIRRIEIYNYKTVY